MRKALIAPTTLSAAVSADIALLHILFEARAEVRKLITKIKGHLEDGRRGEIMRSGVKVSIFGPPNAGKVSTSYLSP